MFQSKPNGIFIHSLNVTRAFYLSNIFISLKHRYFRLDGGSFMHKWQTQIPTSLLSIFIAATLVIGSLGTAPAPVEKAAPASQLIQLGVENPNELVNLIIHKAKENDQAERLVNQLGGKVTSRLDIINAFAAELPAGAVARLAAHASVQYVSLDAQVERSALATPLELNALEQVLTDPKNTYLDTLGVRSLWDQGIKGQGVTVAVIDSGIASIPDFNVDPTLPEGLQVSRILTRQAFNSDLKSGDNSGHGTHIAGILAGNGAKSAGVYAGIAPLANLISLNVSNYEGMAYESDTVAAMQWILENKDQYNIRVVNLSVNSDTIVSYHNSPLDAAAEILWFNGIVVVVSAGNHDPSGEGILFPPANDPFVITVGASDENGTPDPADDFLAPFSASGITGDGFFKPDIVAPGKDIISALAPNSSWDKLYPERVVDKKYFRLSGTSMSAPMVAGAAALLLQSEPYLTPDQVKRRLVDSARLLDETNHGLVSSTTPYLDIYAAVMSTGLESANTGIQASQMLWTGTDPINWPTVNWNSLDWNTVNWNTVNWNTVNWNTVNWNTLHWSSVKSDHAAGKGKGNGGGKGNNGKAKKGNKGKGKGKGHSVNWNSVNWNGKKRDSVNWHPKKHKGVKSH
jgi:serine protease AprX